MTILLRQKPLPQVVRQIVQRDNGAWFDPEDMSTMYQDAAGTTPVTALEQPVGLWLDKSQGLELGSEKVPSLTDASSWNVVSGVTVAGGYISYSGVSIGGGSGVADVKGTEVNGRSFTCIVTYTITSLTGSVSFGYAGTAAGTPRNNPGTYMEYIHVPSITAARLGLVSRGGGVTQVSVTNISVREIKGNHATQSITASRPTLSARYNLLTKTEDFADAAWLKANGATVQQFFTGPDGRLSAAKLIAPVGTGIDRDVRQTVTYNGQAQITWYVKKAEFNFCMFVGIGRSPNGGEFKTILDLTTLQQSQNVGAQELIAVRDEATGWIKVSVSKPTISGSTLLEMRFSPVNSLVDTSITGDGVSGIYIAHPSIYAGSAPLPYQRVNTATDYDSVGWPKYLKFDGIDDYLNLPYMGLYANWSASVVFSRGATPRAGSSGRVLSEGNTGLTNPQYSLARELPSPVGFDSLIINNSGSIILDSIDLTGVANPCIISVIDTSMSVSLYSGALITTSNYSRTTTTTLNTTTIGALAGSTTLSFATMPLYGLIITKSALSDTDRRRCEKFLASRLSTLGVTLL